MKNNNYLKLLIVCGVLLFSVLSFFFIRATATVSAVVPNQEISAGTRIEESMIDIIQVPVNTPKGYITDKTSLLGQKLKVTVNENQLLYISNIMSSWEDFNNGESIPDDYIVTSIQLPPSRAVGGLITAGDVVDILGVLNSKYSNMSKENLANVLGDVTQNSYGEEGMNLYWILSNVRILETDSSLSDTNQSSISTVTGETNSSDGDFYIIALSYDDYKKLRLCEQYLDLWMNIAPAQNEENGPMLDEMTKTTIDGGLKNSQTQSNKTSKKKGEE